jgi:predicted ribosome quality control (RQC) complex YloA/Tae2 family protein
MLTDWMLMRRAAVELDRALRGARVADAGMLDDGRFGVRLSGRRGRPDVTLAADLFGSPPLATLEDDELSLAGDAGWARAASVALRGSRTGNIRSRRGDRVLVVDFGTTSRFGVEQGHKLVLELIPRFGNALVLKDGLIIAAAKQFSPAENEARSVGVGGPYRPPPLTDVRLPRLLLASLEAEAAAIVWPTPARREAWIATRSAALLAATEGESDGLGPIHVYREDGRLVAAHIVPLHQYAQLEHTTADELLPLLREARLTSAGRRASDAGERRRTALTGRIEKRLRDAEAEIAQVAARIADAAGRDRLREAGDALYTWGHDIPPGASVFETPGESPVAIALDPELDAKANAARYFARYRKATDALPHLERRRDALAAKREALEELAFEAERADVPTLSELADALDQIEGRRPAKTRVATRARKPLRIERPSGARIFVGRSPRENVEVTFRIARPDDLWFHARGMPGSHVVLQPPPGATPDDDDLALAADLAAHHSRGRTAPRVDIDFTERKYVRKQRDAGPGLVWYTNARTRVGRPDAAAAIEPG